MYLFEASAGTKSCNERFDGLEQFRHLSTIVILNNIGGQNGRSSDDIDLKKGEQKTVVLTAQSAIVSASMVMSFVEACHFMLMAI